MSYATVAELKKDINLTDASGTWTATLQRCLDAATKAINRFCRRPDGFVADTTATARYYPGSGGPVQRIDECASVTAVAVKDSSSDDEDSYTSWTVGTVGSTTGADVFPATGDPEYPDFNSTPHTFLLVGANGSYSTFPSGRYTTRGGFEPEFVTTRGVPVVKVTARWGYAATVPDDIKEATIMQSARWYKRLQSAMADSVASADFGVLQYRKLDPEIQHILVDGGYIRRSIGRR
jgi:hypothetical protein